MAQISVIVPVYNVEKYLSRCVDSILNQSFSDFELILVDDGSPDRCGELCDTYAQSDTRVTVIHQKNGGLSAARNAGLDYVFAHSNSEWIAFIDSDDWVSSKYLEILRSAAKTTGSEISACDFLETDGHIENTDLIIPEWKVISPETYWVKNRTAATTAWGKLYAKNVFRSLRYPVEKLHEDEFTTYLALFRFQEIAVSPAKIYYYFMNPDGIMQQKEWNIRHTDGIQAFSEQCRYFNEGGYTAAEAVSGKALFIGCAEVLNNLLTLYPDEKGLIRHYRSVFRRTRRKYRAHLDYSMVGSKKNYMRLAHPTIMKLRRKGKHALIFIRRLFHA